MGRYTMAMISSPKIVGPRTSCTASRMTFRRSSPLAVARRWTTFSTWMTELSTRSPKSIAPRLIKLPATPTASIMLLATSIESGMVAATITPARTSRRNAKSTMRTRSAPSSRFVCTVSSTRSTSVVRS